MFKKILIMLLILLPTKLNLIAQQYNSILFELPENTAIDLGQYTCNQPEDQSDYCASITDYSGFVYDNVNKQMLMFGGGHAATHRTDVDVFNLSTLQWQSAYPSTMCSEMLIDNRVTENASWSMTGHPISRHTYDMLVFDQNIGKMLMLNGSSGQGGCVEKGSSYDPYFLTGKIAWYDPITKIWDFSSVSPQWYYAASAEFDPISGKVIVLGANTQGGVGRLWLYDHITEELIAGPYYPSSMPGGSQNLVYFPPNQKMYYITGKGEVWEVTIDGNNFGNSTVTQMSGVTGDLPNVVETGWAYDRVNRIIGGGINNGHFYAFDPYSKVWKSRVIQSNSGDVGTLAFHALDYDSVNNVFIFITNSASGRHTWAYRYSSNADPGMDEESPTIPNDLKGSALSADKAILSWTGSSDNVGIAGYRIYRDGPQIATTNDLTYTDSGLNYSTSYSYTVAALDTAGNLSPQTQPVTVRTEDISDSTAPSVSIISHLNGSLVTGLVTITGSANDNVGIDGIQFMLDGNPIGDEIYVSPFILRWDSTNYSNGDYLLTAIARDVAGNTAMSSPIQISISNLSVPKSEPENTINITNLSGMKQTNRPVSIARPFIAGEILNYVQAIVNGDPVLTQTDVKNRWTDGSVKFAIVSFVVPDLPANGSVTVHFSNQISSHNDGYLRRSDMLDPAYDFEALIEMTATSTQAISARTMLADGNYRYWLRGPIVTAVIIEDRTDTRTYDKDFGDGSKALHPIFEAWFYPQNHAVDVGATVENCWASSDPSKGMRDLTYSLQITSGYANRETQYTQSEFTHSGMTRWHKRFWIPSNPGFINIGHNPAYLVKTKAIPNYDTELAPDPSLISEWYSRWQNLEETSKYISGNDSKLGFYPKAGGLASGGSHPWIGLSNLWDILYLLTSDQRMLEISLEMADLGGQLPYYLREADVSAGGGGYFDVSGTVDTIGRPVSINARPTVTLGQLDMIIDPTDAIAGFDQVSFNGFDFYARGRHHMPDTAYIPYIMTGRYYYLEQLQLQAAYIIGWRVGGSTESWMRQGSNGFFNGGETRGVAWSYRTTSYAAFISPENSPEKEYFEDKLLNTIACDEGKRNIPLSSSVRFSQWSFGKSNPTWDTGPSPLGFWEPGISDYVQAPIKTDGSVLMAGAPWQNNFVMSALGVSRDFGYPTGRLLEYMARYMFNQLLNPATTPYLIDRYINATILSTNDWIQNWEQIDDCYSDLPTSWTIGQDVDHGYGYIALGALSFLYPYQVDGYTGAQAWDFYKNNKPEQNRFATESPKWNILPRTQKYDRLMPPTNLMIQ